MATQPTTNKNDRHSRQSQSQGERTPRTRPQRAAVNQVEQYWQRGNEQLRDIVTDREGQAVLTALALGFGFGVAIGYAIGGPSREQECRWDRATAEGLGRKVLARIDQMLPTAITDRLHG